PARAPAPLEGEPRQRRRRDPPGRPVRGGRGRGQPALPDQGGASGGRLDRRGLRSDARRLRRVPGRRVLLGLDPAIPNTGPIPAMADLIQLFRVNSAIGWGGEAGERPRPAAGVAPPRPKLACVEATVRRTLVKSAPEL